MAYGFLKRRKDVEEQRDAAPGPVVNLGQKYAFNPGDAEQWLSYILIAAGWTLATTVAAGAARFLRRG